MGPWGFVGLAYGIVWGIILLYTVSLRRRYQRARAELQALESAERDEKK